MMARDRGGVVSHEKVDLLQLAGNHSKATQNVGGGRERRKSGIPQSFAVGRHFGRALIPAAEYDTRSNTFPDQR